jgi:uncharacterized membrane protein
MSWNEICIRGVGSMVYEYERDVIDELEQMGADYESNGYFNMSIEVEEIYSKAKAFDRIKTIHDKNVNEMSISDTECIEMIGNELERG